MAVNEAATKAKPKTKAEERVAIEQRFAKRILAEYGERWDAWRAKADALQRDHEWTAATIVAHGQPCTVETATYNTGWVKQLDDGTLRLLTWERARERAEHDAGERPSLRDMLARATLPRPAGT